MATTKKRHTEDTKEIEKIIKIYDYKYHQMTKQNSKRGVEQGTTKETEFFK